MKLKIKINKKIQNITKAIEEKKGEAVVILDLRGTSDMADFFIICGVSSDRQAKAIADNIIEELDKNKEKVWHIEGYKQGLWILLDCGEIIVHIFKKDTRDFYNLEKLWGFVPRKNLV